LIGPLAHAVKRISLENKIELAPIILPGIKVSTYYGFEFSSFISISTSPSIKKIILSQKSVP
jgi:hypothetical protein